jgi:hypothetical protein
MRSGLRTSRPGLALQFTSCPRVCPSKLKPLHYSDVIHESGGAMGVEDTGPMHDVKRSSQEINLVGGGQSKKNEK